MAYSKQYYLDNKEVINECNNRYYLNNRKKVLERHRQWYKDNKEYSRKYHRSYYLIKYRTNLKFNLSCKVSRAINIALKGDKAGRHWEDLVGYSLNDLIKRLEETIPDDYSWNDYLNGKLHLDHIVPQKAFVFENSKDKEFKACWGLCNLRLLPVDDNLIKSEHFDNPILLWLLIKNESRGIQSDMHCRICEQG